MVKSCPSPNPASTLTNVKYANDNISTGDSIFQARVQCTLNANTDYIVVTSGSNNATQGTFNNQISGPGTPTIVKLIAFSASGYADGVLLAWRTGYEVDNLGFRLYRDEGEQVQRPATIVANQPSQWRKSGQGADLVIISHRDFPGSLEPLRALRQGQGLAVTVVDYGQQSPYAVKDFLRYAVQQWKPAPRFVLLVGHASYDPKGYLGYGGSDLVPTKLIDTQLMETASHDWFVDLDDDGLADMAMGRLPVRTTQEASELVAKIVGYETPPSSYSVLLVAGRNDTYNFEGATKELHSMIPAEASVEAVFAGQMDADSAERELLDSLNRGPRLVNYTGHGSVDLWGGQLLTAARWANPGVHRAVRLRAPLLIRGTGRSRHPRHSRISCHCFQSLPSPQRNTADYGGVIVLRNITTACSRLMYTESHHGITSDLKRSHDR